MPHNTFTHALVRVPTPNMGEGITTQQLGAPNFELALTQHAAYCEALRWCGLKVTLLSGDEAYPDGCFVEDAAVIYGDLVVITQPGARSRRGETVAIQQAFSHQPVVQMQGDEFLDGGDVLFCADRVLIGLSQRTNWQGATLLKNVLQDYDASLRVDFVNVGGVLHLKTGITELAPGVIIQSPAFETDYVFDFADVYVVPDAEKHGGHVLPINDAVLLHAGSPRVRDLAHRYYLRVIEIPLSEFEKMDGGVTCLSLRYAFSGA